MYYTMVYSEYHILFALSHSLSSRPYLNSKLTCNYDNINLVNWQDIFVNFTHFLLDFFLFFAYYVLFFTLSSIFSQYSSSSSTFSSSLSTYLRKTEPNRWDATYHADLRCTDPAHNRPPGPQSLYKYTLSILCGFRFHRSHGILPLPALPVHSLSVRYAPAMHVQMHPWERLRSPVHHIQ